MKIISLWMMPILIMMGYVYGTDSTITVTHANQQAIDSIEKVEQAICIADQSDFIINVAACIALLGQIYEQRASLLSGYKASYFIARASIGMMLPVIDEMYSRLLPALENASKKLHWQDCVIGEFVVTKLNSSETCTKLFTLQQLIDLLKTQIPDNLYSSSISAETMIKSGLVAALVFVVVGGIYYGTQVDFNFLKYGYQDLKDSATRMIEYITGPYNYEQFEARHELLSEGLTILQREKRFEEWQLGEAKRYKLEDALKSLHRFEAERGLPADNMNLADRLQIKKDATRYDNKIKQRMEKVKRFENAHQKSQLSSEGLTDEERISREKEYEQGAKFQRKYNEKLAAAEQFEKKHGLLSENMNGEERIRRHKEWKKGDNAQKEHEKLMKEVAAREDQRNLPPKGLHDYQRIERDIKMTAEEDFKRKLKALKRMCKQDPFFHERLIITREVPVPYDPNLFYAVKERDMTDAEKVEYYKELNLSYFERLCLENDSLYSMVYPL